MPWWMPFARSRGIVVVAPKKRAAGGDEPKGSLQPWQKQAWGYYNTLGEIHYGGGFYARMLTGVRLMVEERNSDGEWDETTDADYLDQLSRLENARGGMAALQGQYGRLTFVQGESMLAVTLIGFGEDELGLPITDAEGRSYYEEWEMLSSAELTFVKQSGGNEYRRRRTPGASDNDQIPETDWDDPQPGTMYAWRFYHRDPQYSGLADSSMRAVLLDCEELLLLKQAIRNTARNRGAGNGMVVMPSSMKGQEIDAGDGKMIPAAAKAIYEALTSPIEDENASHAVTPIIVFAPDGTTSQNIFHVDLRGAALYRETGLRDECIRRIAIGLDMPPEALLGVSGSNHWTAWQISDAAWTNHGDPVAREFVEQLTAALITPLVIEKNGDPQDVRIWYDAAEVVQDPDRGRAAADAHDRLTISDEAYRREAGWQEEDAPDDAEWQRRAEIGKKAKSSTIGDSPPQQGQAAVTPERLIGMAEACVLRCREMAGSRLRSRMQAADAPANLRARIKSAQNGDVAAKLAPDVRSDADPDALVAGAGQFFLAGMTKMGLDPGLAETLVRRVEEHAAKTLFDETPGPLCDEVLAICALTSRRV